MKPVIAVLWILSLGLAVALTRFAGPAVDGSGTERERDAGSTTGAVPSFEDAFSEFHPLERAYKISAALRGLGPDNLPELIDVLENENMGVVPEEAKLVMLAWTRFDGPGAYEWAIVQRPENWRTTLTLAAMYGWGFHDGPAAMRIVDEAVDPEARARLEQNAMEGWLKGPDKAGYSEFVANFPDLKRRGRLYFLLAGEIVMTEGRDAAMRWVDDLPDDIPNNLKLGVFSHVAKMVATQEPRKAAEWFVANQSRPFSEGALAGIALRWVQGHDRPAAFEWMLSLDPQDTHAGEIEGGLSQGFRSWMQLDAEAAQAWLLQQLPNPALDPAIQEAAKHLLPRHPDQSFEWAQRLDDPDDRRARSVLAGIRWRDRDPEAFDAWFAEAELSEDVRRKIEEAPRAPRRRGKRQPAEAEQP